MHCTDCGALDWPETRLPGSDRLEVAGWLAGGLPGWLYCAWRNALRAKACAHCGSQALARETRARLARHADREAPVPVPPCSGEGGALPWPHPWRTPRVRLRRGLGWLAAWSVAASGAGTAAAVLALAWLAWESSRGAPPSDACAAWGPDGRPLRIELA